MWGDKMTRSEKQEYLEMPAIAVYSMGLAGLEIKKIEYGIDDHIIFVAFGKTVHRAKIYTAPSGQNYFIFGKTRICLDECMRV